MMAFFSKLRIELLLLVAGLAAFFGYGRIKHSQGQAEEKASRQKETIATMDNIIKANHEIDSLTDADIRERVANRLRNKAKTK